MKEKHNGIIGIWKFIFAILIMLFHSRRLYPLSFFKGGYIGVEFFFVASGYYFALNVLKEDYQKKKIGKDTINFIWKKIKTFIPYLLIVFLGTLILRLLCTDYNIVNMVNSIWNFLLLKSFGFRAPTYSGQLWFLSVLLASMFILYPLIKKYKENFILIFSPLSVIFIMGILSQYKVGLDHSYSDWIFYINTGFLRGFSEINLGMLIYLLSQRLKKIDYTVFGKILLSLISEGLLIVVLVVSILLKSSMKYDYILLLFICASITIMVSKKTIEYKILSNKLINYLEKLSLPIFINHSLIIDLCYYTRIINLRPSIIILLVVGITIILSVIEMYLIELIKRKNIISKCSKIIIKSK